MSDIYTTIIRGLKKSLLMSVLLGSTSLYAASRPPLLIAPMIGGTKICASAIKQMTPQQTAPDLIHYCEQKGENAASLIRNQLEKLEPGGARGNYQIGYTLGVPILSLYKEKAGKWYLDYAEMNRIAQLIQNVGRPVVLYLMLNHFDSDSRLAKVLATQPRNLMQMQNYRAPLANYFESAVIPFTLCTNEEIPVNRFRFQAMDVLLKTLFRSPAKNHIQAVTLGGELHQMFPDFETGLGRFENIQITDYSLCSLQQFREDLKKQFGNIAALNHVLGTTYRTFEQVNLPRENFRQEKLTALVAHIDSYAHGEVPIFGWLAQNGQTPYEKIEILVDGKVVGTATMELNRLDVYQAVREIENPNTGFAYTLNYRQMSAGNHTISVRVKQKNQYFLMKEWTLTVLKSLSDLAQQEKFSPAKKVLNTLPKLSAKYALDHPKGARLIVLYNPLADLFNQFRNRQVEQFLMTLFDKAKAAGVPTDKLYSHQIVPRVNASWNPFLFATDQTLRAQSPYRLGVNLYGGATNSAYIFKMLAGKPYGVPEYHVQQQKQGRVPALNAFRAHYQQGAQFISPYYLSLLPKKLEAASAHAQFRLAPENAAYGSNYLYEAMRQIAAE